MLNNDKVNIRIKLSFLWTSLMFFYIYNDYFELYIPDKINDIISGDSMLNSPTSLIFAALVMAIPAIMIVLSIMLNSKLCKWTNVVFGSIFIVIIALIGASSFSMWYSSYLLYSFIEIVIGILIVRTAWNWPSQNNKSDHIVKS